MNIKVIALALVTSWGAFFFNEKAVASDSEDYYFDDSPRVASQGAFSLRRDRSLPRHNPAEQVVASATVATACNQNFEQPFFGFAPNNREGKQRFQDAMRTLKQTGRSSDLLKDWINQGNTAVKLIGFLDSFKTTLALANPEEVEAIMSPGLRVVRQNLLTRAYNHMQRLISGQVVNFSKKRKATPAQARILLQAAASLGQRFAIEESWIGMPLTLEAIVNSFYDHYNLSGTAGDPRALFHNTVLLKHSVAAVLAQQEMKAERGVTVDSLLQRKGVSLDILGRANTYLDKIDMPLGLSPYLEDIMRDTQTIYDSRELKGINILQLDPEMVAEKFRPYGREAFDVLRNPNTFITDLTREFKARATEGDSRGWVDEMLPHINTALRNPQGIPDIPGFGNGSVHSIRDMGWEDQRRETILTWLNAAHDFVAIYFYCKNHDMLERFYTEPTPGDDTPCLPGKIRGFQAWFELASGDSSGIGIKSDSAVILEQIFIGGGAGIQMSAAIRMFYAKHLDVAAMDYCMDYNLDKQITIPHTETEKYAKEMLRRALTHQPRPRGFYSQHFTRAGLEVGIIDIVKAQLDDVIDKFVSQDSEARFPRPAFHGYKYGSAQLENKPHSPLRGNEALIQCFRNQIQAQIDTLMTQTLRSFGLVEDSRGPSLPSRPSLSFVPPVGPYVIIRGQPSLPPAPSGGLLGRQGGTGLAVSSSAREPSLPPVPSRGLLGRAASSNPSRTMGRSGMSVYQPF